MNAPLIASTGPASTSGAVYWPGRRERPVEPGEVGERSRHRGERALGGVVELAVRPHELGAGRGRRGSASSAARRVESVPSRIAASGFRIRTHGAAPAQIP